MRFRKRIITWAVIFIGLILAYLYIVLDLINPILQENTNTLAVGQRAIVESLSIPISSPIELDGKSQDEILALRQEAALQFPWLLYTEYKPDHAVFSQIDDGKPWWGVTGLYYYGRGEMSAAGPSEESRYILNPYLLVAADFTGVSILSGRSPDAFWNQNLITPAGLESQKFPYYVSTSNLRWWPERKRVEVSYDLSEYLARLTNWTSRTYNFKDASFDLIAYNARDFNMNYMYVDYGNSIYIRKEIPPPEALAISHFLHRGDSCGLEGGCNNMSPETPEFMDLQIEKLPAKVIIYLWRDRPAAVTDEPNLSYVINIR